MSIENGWREREREISSRIHDDRSLTVEIEITENDTEEGETKLNREGQ